MGKHWKGITTKSYFFQVKFPIYEGKELGFLILQFSSFSWVAEGQRGDVQYSTKFFSSVHHSYDLFLDMLIHRLSQNWSGILPLIQLFPCFE